jgi:hypothetical protein
LAAFSRRFSFKVFSGFFFVSFFASCAFAIGILLLCGFETHCSWCSGGPTLALDFEDTPLQGRRIQ